MKRKVLCLAPIIPLAALATGWFIFRSRSIERIASAESLDDLAVAAAFSRIAGWPQMRLLRRYLVGRITNLAPVGEAIDIGCGPGHLVLELAGELPDVTLTGFDLADTLLAQATDAAASRGLSGRVHFEAGDAQAIPRPDQTVDMVVSSLSLHHWRDPVAVLDEVARVLRPGGAFCIFDLRRDMAAPFYLPVWLATHLVVPEALRQANEPLASRDAAYTVAEATALAEQSLLTGWRLVGGPMWLVIEGHTLSAAGDRPA